MNGGKKIRIQNKGIPEYHGEGTGGIDNAHVLKLIEEKKRNFPDMLLPVDIELILRLDADQFETHPELPQVIRLKTTRHCTLIHLGVLCATKSGLKEDEWTNFDFLPHLATTQPLISQEIYASMFINDYLRPYFFRASIHEILKQLVPG